MCAAITGRSEPVLDAAAAFAGRAVRAGYRWSAIVLDRLPAGRALASGAEAVPFVAPNWSRRAAWNAALLNALAALVGALPQVSPETLQFAVIAAHTASTLVGAAVWSAVAAGADVAAINDLGLVAALPPAAFLVFLPLTLGFCVELRRHTPRPTLLALYIATQIYLLFGVSSLVEEVPRFHVAWRHVGIIEYVTRNGAVDPRLDAFFNWPGFFILAAFAVEVMGLRDAIPLIEWAPVFFNALYVLPLALLLRSATDDRRVVWFGLWLFVLTNWVGQDYLAPQALAYFWFLTVAAVLVRWFRRIPAKPNPRWPHWRRLGRLAPRVLRLCTYEWATAAGAPAVASGPWQRVGLVAVVVALLVAVVPTHQLTPFFTLAVMAALLVFNRLTLRGLPIILGTLSGGWLCFMAVAFLSGHISWITDDIGKVGNIMGRNVGERLQGSPEHLFIVRVRMAMTLAIGVLAAFGALRRLRRGRIDLPLALVALAPVPLLGMLNYGGEMLLRVYLFTLPGMSYFAAALFFPDRQDGRGWRSGAALGLASLALCAGFFFARYGNERMDYFTPDEVAAVEHVYRVAEPGSLLLAGTWSLPWKHKAYEAYNYESLDPAVPRSREIYKTADAELLAARMRAESGERDAYFILTRSQKAQLELFSGLEPGVYERLVAAVHASAGFEVAYENADAVVFRLVKEPDLYAYAPEDR